MIKYFFTVQDKSFVLYLIHYPYQLTGRQDVDWIITCNYPMAFPSADG